MFKNKKIVLFLLVLPLVAVLVAPKVALADDDSDWVKNIPIIGGVVDFASDPGGWITDRFAEGAEFFFNDGLQNIKTTSTKSILGKSFNNLLGKKTGTFYSTVSFVNKSVVMPTAASILSLVMLIQLIKISQRIDGTATLPAIKDIAIDALPKDSTYDKASETIRANADIDIAERRKSVLPDQAGLAAKKASCIESLAHIGGNAPVCGQDEIAR